MEVSTQPHHTSSPYHGSPTLASAAAARSEKLPSATLSNNSPPVHRPVTNTKALSSSKALESAYREARQITAIVCHVGGWKCGTQRMNNSYSINCRMLGCFNRRKVLISFLTSSSMHTRQSDILRSTRNGANRSSFT